MQGEGRERRRAEGPAGGTVRQRIADYLSQRGQQRQARVRGLISGHLSLHVSYVREDIGVPPRIDRALAITERVPVDIRIFGPSVDWASDPNFPRVEELDFEPSPRFSDSPDAWADELAGVDFAEADNHSFLRIRQGGYDIVVSTPRIADQPSGLPDRGSKFKVSFLITRGRWF